MNMGTYLATQQFDVITVALGLFAYFVGLQISRGLK
jgi:hypothetical protein